MRADRKISGIMLLVSAVSMIAILSSGCSIESPKSPTWDTKLSIPLISQHYDIYELIDRLAEDAISYDSMGEISISFKQNIDTFIIDAGLSIGDINENFVHDLGSVAIATPEPVSLHLNLTDYLPLATGEVPEVETIRKDVRDVEIGDVEGFDAIIHLAGLSNDPLGDYQPELTYDINFQASARIAKLAKQAGVPRFLFASSCSKAGHSKLIRQ